jgi:hypothetical protein
VAEARRAKASTSAHLAYAARGWPPGGQVLDLVVRPTFSAHQADQQHQRRSMNSHANGASTGRGRAEKLMSLRSASDPSHYVPLPPPVARTSNEEGPRGRVLLRQTALPLTGKDLRGGPSSSDPRRWPFCNARPAKRQPLGWQCWCPHSVSTMVRRPCSGTAFEYGVDHRWTTPCAF